MTRGNGFSTDTSADRTADGRADGPAGRAGSATLRSPKPAAGSGLQAGARGGSVEAVVEVAGQAPQQVRWLIAEEVPVALLYNGRSKMVMMTSPADLEDFAVGITITEGIVPGIDEIEGIEIAAKSIGYEIDLTVPRERMARRRLRERGITGGTGCGLCGVETLAEAVRDPQRVARPMQVAKAAVSAALRELPGWQPMNADNRSTHAAAWCTPEGAIVTAREDVGRHNALDKLIGALLRAGRDPADGFVVMSSRCSFELVQKVAAVGIPYLATISAPTALALSLAEASGIRLAARAPNGIVEFDPETARH